MFPLVYTSQYQEVLAVLLAHPVLNARPQVVQIYVILVIFRWVLNLLVQNVVLVLMLLIMDHLLVFLVLPVLTVQTPILLIALLVPTH